MKYRKSSNVWIPFGDVMSTIMAIFLITSILLVVQYSPQHHKKDSDIQSPGSLMVEIFWKPNVDIDLWIQTPDDGPIGYTRKNGKYIDLLKDDLGLENSKVNDMHYENAYARNIPEGIYIINIHWYMDREDHPKDVEIKTHLSIMDKDSKKEPVVVDKISVLTEISQEFTVMRVSIDNYNNITTIDDVQTPLRNNNK